MLDGLTGVTQEKMRSQHQTGSHSMMANVNLWSILYLTISEYAVYHMVIPPQPRLVCCCDVIHVHVLHNELIDTQGIHVPVAEGAICSQREAQNSMDHVTVINDCC